MSTRRSLPTRCGPGDGCVVCSDEGVPMIVERLCDPGLALCRDGDGTIHEVLVGLVPDSAPGHLLLVHAGTALLRLEDA